MISTEDSKILLSTENSKIELSMQDSKIFGSTLKFYYL